MEEEFTFPFKLSEIEEDIEFIDNDFVVEYKEFV